MPEETLIAAPVFDPFGYGIELPLQTTVSPLGFRTRLVTNSPDVLQTTEEAWGSYPHLFSDKSLEIRVQVSDNETVECPTGIVSRAQKHVMSVMSDQHNFAVCDLDRGLACLWLAPATARNRDFLRLYYLESVLYMMLWHSHLTKLHAACVSRNGRGVLLCGESGAGKTCLSFACARRGWTFVSDDRAALVRRSHPPLVVGGPRHMHFRPTAIEILPELHGRLSKANSTGKVGIEVRTEEFPAITRTMQAEVAAIIFLNRQAGASARLGVLTPDDAFSRLASELPLMEDYENQLASLRALAEVGSFELCYHDLDDAVGTLASLVQ